MNKLLLIAFILLASLSLPSSAHHLSGHGGCCCDPIAGASFVPTPSDCPSGYQVLPQPVLGETCDDVCQTTGIPPSQQPPPTPPGTPPAGCGSPGYAPAPKNLLASDIKGEKKIKLEFTLECPVDYLNISRCKGQGCTNFAEVAQIAHSASFTDASQDLEWNQNYNYRITAYYTLQEEASSPSLISKKLGDLECWSKGTENFCISSFYYEQFEIYLKRFGYLNTQAGNFVANFEQSVDATFNQRFNKAFFCNDKNELQATATSCSSNQVCVSDEQGARCITPQPCENGKHFGLYYNIAVCEGATANKYCFLDKSSSHIDKCFSCSQRMQCYDYKSKSACERDPCFAGRCSWKDTYQELGIGVCIDQTKSNCLFCDKEGSSGMPNLESYNKVFDKCSEQKAIALSTAGYPCFYNRNTGTGAGCEMAKCKDYSPSQCASPANGITLKPDNSLQTSSSDVCQIKVCQYDQSTGCAKNADGSQGSDWEDCKGLSDSEREACELDFMPPETTLVMTGVKGKIDYINIKIFDKSSKTDSGMEMQGQPGHSTSMCILSDTDKCDNANAFPINTTAVKLNVNDLSLQEGQKVIGTFKEGFNTLKFYSQDKYKNLEIVKAVSVYACNNCSGPKALGLEIIPGREVDGIHYTSSSRPVIKVSFNEPSEIISASLSKQNQNVQITITPSSGFNLGYQFVPSQSLPDGSYAFSVNAKDNNGVLMDFLSSISIVVDTVRPTVIVNPANNEAVNATPIILTLNFSEKVIPDIKLEESIFIDKYARRLLIRSLGSILTSLDNKTFSGSIASLNDGVKKIVIYAEDFAVNILNITSAFFISKEAPKIRMKNPTWGVSSTATFDLVIETTSLAQCKYIYNTPAAPSFSDFDIFSNFDITNSFEHVKRGFSLPSDNREHPLHVYCKYGNYEVQESFSLSIDTAKPVIETAFASPETVIEPLYPDQKIYVTTLKVQTNEPSFCRYDNETANFESMKGVFPGYEETAMLAHIKEINVSEEREYNYKVVCKDLAELKSDASNVKFKVDLNIPFMAKSNTPPFFNTTTATLAIETNKRAYCYYGTEENAISACLGNCSFATAHTQDITVPEFGNYTYYVQCNNAGLGEISDVLAVNFYVGDSIPGAVCTANEECAEGYCSFGVCSSEQLPCFDGMLTGTETGIDCGGACPNKCSENQGCSTILDCMEGLNCVDSICSTRQITGDLDSDGVSDDLDSCPGTPLGEQADEFGCSASQRDSDNDGMPDAWELQYGLDIHNPLDANEDLDGDELTNIEEYRNKTNPSDQDTDKDKWNDKEELDDGYDPLDPESHPKSGWLTVLWALLIIVLIAALGAGGYYLYKSYKAKKARKPVGLAKPSQAIAPARTIERIPAAGVHWVEDKLAKLRKFAKGTAEKTEKEDKHWLTFEELRKIGKSKDKKKRL